jgi:hypothetical protein
MLIVADVAETADVHPSLFVTVNVYVPGAKPANVVAAPLPVVVAPPGLAVTVHDPEGGKPVKSTLPVPTKHVGWVTAPNTGAAGVTGCAFIVAEVAEAIEVQPSLFVTVNV